MRVFLLLIIRMYWILIPKSKRRRRIFKTSCSRYVFDITKEEGFNKGIIAILFRYKNCRSGYSILNIENRKLLISATNEIFTQEEIQTRILTNPEPHEY